MHIAREPRRVRAAATARSPGTAHDGRCRDRRAPKFAPKIDEVAGHVGNAPQQQPSLLSAGERGRPAPRPGPICSRPRSRVDEVPAKRNEASGGASARDRGRYRKGTRRRAASRTSGPSAVMLRRLPPWIIEPSLASSPAGRSTALRMSRLRRGHDRAKRAGQRISFVAALIEILDLEEQAGEVLVDPEPDQKQREDDQMPAANNKAFELQALRCWPATSRQPK